MSTDQLEILTGGLSSPSKMPCHGYSLPASKCRTGGKLRDVEGGVCARCYAMRGRFNFDNVQTAMHRRWRSVVDADEQNIPVDQGWALWMVELIGRQEKSGYMRIHDSGDLVSVSHLLRIFWIARRLPHIKFWLPTREVAFVREALSQQGKPKNLTIRLSATLIDGPAPVGLAKRLGVRTSGVVTNGATCPAPRQGGVCGDCRACWDSKRHVTYTLH